MCVCLKSKSSATLIFFIMVMHNEIASAMQTKPIRYTKKIYLTLLVCSVQMALRQARRIKYFPRNHEVGYFDIERASHAVKF